MKLKRLISVFATGTLLLSGTMLADETGDHQNAKAIDVLTSMSAYIKSLDRFVIQGESLQDATLGQGLIVSNSTGVTIKVDRPGSLRISSFDGVEHKEIIVHDGMLTVSNLEKGLYAQASVPNDMGAALDFALEKFDLDAPMMDLLKQDSSNSLLGSQDAILYLTDKARISGEDCHHIAIRGREVDVQLWIQEGDQPLPRQFMMTSKWEGGSPRLINRMTWDTETDLQPDDFTFTAPEGAMNIGFIENTTDGGE